MCVKSAVKNAVEETDFSWHHYLEKCLKEAKEQQPPCEIFQVCIFHVRPQCISHMTVVESLLQWSGVAHPQTVHRSWQFNEKFSINKHTLSQWKWWTCISVSRRREVLALKWNYKNSDFTNYRRKLCFWRFRIDVVFDCCLGPSNRRRTSVCRRLETRGSSSGAAIGRSTGDGDEGVQPTLLSCGTRRPPWRQQSWVIQCLLSFKIA